MERYEALAREFFEALDASSSVPPNDRVSETMRGEAAVMRLLMRQGKSLTPGEVGRLLGMTSSRVAAVLNGLEKKGLVLREADDRDRRRVQVTLTREGKVFCEHKQRCAVGDLSLLLAQLGEEDAAHFVRLSRRVMEMMPRLKAKGRMAEEKGETR